MMGVRRSRGKLVGPCRRRVETHPCCRFQLLGPLEVRDGERVARRSAGGSSAPLLAVLALRAGEPVSPDRLVEDIWGESPPQDGAARARELRLASCGGRSGVTSFGPSPPATRSSVAPEQVDAMRLERLLDEREAPPAPARSGCGSELARIRGQPLDDLAFEPFAQTRRAAPPGARAHGARGARRARARARAPRRRRPRRSRRSSRASVPRAPARAADARALPLRPPGGRPRRVPGRPPHARRGARDRPGRGAAGARAGDPPPGRVAPRAAAGRARALLRSSARCRRHGRRARR